MTNCGSNPGPFADRANILPLSYWATWSYHQQFSTWNLPRLHMCFTIMNSWFSFALMHDLLFTVVLEAQIKKYKEVFVEACRQVRIVLLCFFTANCHFVFYCQMSLCFFTAKCHFVFYCQMSLCFLLPNVTLFFYCQMSLCFYCQMSLCFFTVECHLYMDILNSVNKTTFRTRSKKWFSEIQTQFELNLMYGTSHWWS